MQGSYQVNRLSVLEICSGAGGQSLGLEWAGFDHVGALDNDHDACETLKANRPKWNVIEDDVTEFKGFAYEGIDLFAGGVPCPPFSIAGKGLGHEDERDLFPHALRLISEAQPRAVLLENVRGLATSKFDRYRARLQNELSMMGYESEWRLLNACDYGVSQLRPRFILVALRPQLFRNFHWPEPGLPPKSVGDKLFDLMASRGWPGAPTWSRKAKGIAPTIVGGSKKHGGPDLGPTRAREEWLKLGVDGRRIAELAPGPDYPIDGAPYLTVGMVARLQGFPDSWKFVGRKTSRYKQVGNAFPPPVALAVGMQIAAALSDEAALIVSKQDPQLRLMERSEPAWLS
jgi:DNA (cytosine-5)-methyltransferase 1